MLRNVQCATGPLSASKEAERCARQHAAAARRGAGGAQVYKAVLDGTQPVAVKKLLRSDDHLDAKFLREIAILKECHSTQVVQVHAPPPALLSVGFGRC